MDSHARHSQDLLGSGEPSTGESRTACAPRRIIEHAVCIVKYFAMQSKYVSQPEVAGFLVSGDCRKWPVPIG
jgi:hypothetical protein